MKEEAVILGSGTSYGVPMVACACPVCTSTDPKDARLRCSCWLKTGGKSLLIDVSPDFRIQALRAGIQHLDAVIITHVHADHVFGMDDLRPLSLARSSPLPVFADARACNELRQVFGYIFQTTKRRQGVPWLELHEITPGQPFWIGGVELVTAALPHGRGVTQAVRCGGFAWMTDFKELTHEAAELMQGLNTLALDMLREEPHGTHLCLAEALGIRQKLGAPRTWFIHMGHEVSHRVLDEQLPKDCALAWDGLTIPVS